MSLVPLDPPEAPAAPPPNFREDLAQALSQLTDDAIERITAGELEPLLRMWAQINLLVSELNDLAAEVQAAAVPLMPWEENPRTGKRAPKPVVVDGLGVLQLQPGPRQVVWDIEGAVKAVVTDALAKGEIGHPLDVVNVIREAAGGGLQYLKVGALNDRGIDADEYRAAEYGKSKLRFVG